MTDIDNAMVADVVSLINGYHKALGPDASRYAAVRFLDAFVLQAGPQKAALADLNGNGLRHIAQSR